MEKKKKHGEIHRQKWETHRSLNVSIEHHPTIRYMVYNGYYKVMSNIPKMGQLTTPENMLDMDLIDLILISGYGSNGPIWSNHEKKL